MPPQTPKEFLQVDWDPQLEDECRQLVHLAVLEDLGALFDWTTISLVSENAQGAADICAREAGVIAGLPAAKLALEEMNAKVHWRPSCRDGDFVQAGQVIASLSGSARDLLTSERLLLNLLGKLSGVATITRRFVEAVAHTDAHVYDTRKTTPGWRGLEKYAVRCGGGRNHRRGLYSAVLIKDNHLAFFSHSSRQGGSRADAGAAVAAVRSFLEQAQSEYPLLSGMIIEVEVDTLDQLRSVLPCQPDIVLLDNMTTADLRAAVRLRDEQAPTVQLEASGGVRLETIAAIAETGVERISAGALTHAAIGLDLGMDWNP